MIVRDALSLVITLLLISTNSKAGEKIAYCSVAAAPPTSPIRIQIPVEAARKCSLKSVFDAISAQGKTAKGEFESTAAYKSRMAKVMDAELIPGIKLSGNFAVVVPIDPNFLSYDADKQAFRTIISDAAVDQVTTFAFSNIDWTQAKMGELFEYIEVSRNTVSSVYPAETRMGVKFIVRKETGEIWALHLVPEIKSAAMRTLPPPPLLYVPGAEAPAVKENLAVVLVGMGVNPPVTTGFNSNQVSLTDPHDYETTIHDLWFHPNAAYVVRLDTGAVLATATYGKNGMGLFSDSGKSRAAPHRHKPQ